MEKHEFSKYERARILGARALQISMDAPLLIKMEGEELENLNYDPLKIAQRELDSVVLPITVNRPMPLKRDEKLKEIKIDELAKDEEKPEKDESDEESIAPIAVEKVQDAVELKSDEEMEEEMEGEDFIETASESEDDSSD